MALVLHPFLLQFHDHLISPKEFVHLAGKSTLKDWKRAIRMNGIMLRLVPSSGHFFLGDCGGVEQSLWSGCFAAEGANEPLNVWLNDQPGTRCGQPNGFVLSLYLGNNLGQEIFL